MQKFIKFLEIIHITDEYYLYRIYSGNDELEIKERIIEDLKDSWKDEIGDFPQELNASASLEDIQNKMTELMQMSKVEDYYDLYLDLATDLNDVISFYNQFDEKQNKEPSGNYYSEAEVDFYAYGDEAIDLENMLPYLSRLQSENEIYFSDKVVQKISQIIGNNVI